MRNDIIKQPKGSFTLEATIIFPIVMLTVVMVLFMGIYLHDATVLQAIINEAAQRSEDASLYKNELVSENPNPLKERLDKGLYWRFNSDSIYDQVDAIKGFIMEEANRKLILNNVNDMIIKFNIDNYLIYKTLEIEVFKPYNNYFDTITPIFDKISVLNINISTNTSIIEPVEIIRNINFLDETTDKNSLLRGIKEDYNKTLQSLYNMLN